MKTTLQILDDRMEREQDTSHRSHLGASSIGGECERKTWYSFRWALEPDFTADVLRKFRDGHESEELIACLLYTSPSPRDGLLSRMPSSA